MSEDDTPTIGSERLHALVRGTADRSVPVAFEDLEDAARENLRPAAFDYVTGGAGESHTVTENRRAFDDWRLRPAMLRGATDVDLGIEILETSCASPLWLAPVGAQTVFHEDGEVASARGADAMTVPMMVSSVAANTIEDVAAAAGDTPTWFQLYPASERAVTESFVRRAEAAEYEAIVVTVDTPSYPWREGDLTNRFHPQVEGHVPATYYSDPAFRDGLADPPEADPDAAEARFHDLFAAPDLDWDRVSEIAAMTDLPVLLKGILRGDDATRAIEAGADGIIVSNHGGRQVDRAVPTLEVLPEVREAVGDDVPVLLDSGVRSGADIVIALGLGADAVCFGRPYLYGLTVAGAEGVAEVLANTLTELESMLAQTGHASPTAVDRDAVSRRP